MEEIGRHYYNIPELNATTREIPEFEDLMNMRMEALNVTPSSTQISKNFLKLLNHMKVLKNF